MTFHLELKSNAFRILGLHAGALLSEAHDRAYKLRAALSWGQVRPLGTDYPVFAPPERRLETIASALQRLEDPLTRLLDEATWFHLTDATDASAGAALAQGNQARALAVWDDAVARSTDPLTRLRYAHNLAVLYLYLAEAPATPVESPQHVWNRAVEAWVPLLSNHTFWRSLVDQSPSARDPRVRSDLSLVLRAEVAYALVRGRGRRAVEALAGGRKDMLDALAELIRARLESVTAAVAETTARPPGLQSLESRLCLARAAFEQLQSLGPGNALAIKAAADFLADTYRGLALHSANGAEHTGKALELIEAAAGLAASEGLRIQLMEDRRRLKWSAAVGIFKSAIQAGDYAGAHRAFKVLEQNRGPVGGPEGLEALRKDLRNLRSRQTDTRIPRGPRPHTICGVGTRLYGEGDKDPETGRRLATLFFTFFFIPLIALGRYRVRELGEGRYRFYSKVPLTKRHRAWNLAAVGVLLGLLAIGFSYVVPLRAAGAWCFFWCQP